MTTKIDVLKNEVYKGDNAQLICDLIIASALEVNASDIHIEPLSGFVRIRFRVDGILREVLEYQKFIHTQLVARFKILANLKIDESRMPQDGRISTTIDSKSVDLRISTLPTVNGEKIVMRIVDKSKKIPELATLGIEWHNKEVLNKALALPNGIILTSGPTGSGKSTTLYACLSLLNKPNVNIMTLEDPVENTIDGINQSQVFPEIGYSFANGLRTALRQDPDIIMVGEIRDKETINIAIEASLTGHLVVSTIHTNSAAETITRMLNMGVQAFLLPASVNAIMAQRLVRRICPHCAKKVLPEDLHPNTQEMLKQSIARTKKAEITARFGESFSFNNVSFLQPVGCEECNNEWYKGRLGLYEIMEITPEVKALIFKWESSMAIHEAAVAGGMVSLEQDGVLKAMAGFTSLEEVYAAVKEG